MNEIYRQNSLIEYQVANANVGVKAIANKNKRLRRWTNYTNVLSPPNDGSLQL